MPEESALLDVEYHGDCVLVIARRDLDGFVSTQLEEASRVVLEELGRRPEVQHAVVDLEQAAYFASAMIAAMISLKKQCEARDGRMALCGLSEFAEQLLATFRLNEFWMICADRDEAFARVRGEG